MEKTILRIKEEIFLSFVFSLAAAGTWFQLQIEKLQTTNTLKQTETREERERDSHGISWFSIRSVGLSLHFLSFENPSGYGGKLEMEAMQFSA